MERFKLSQAWFARLKPLLIVAVISCLGVIILNVSRAATYTNYRDPVTRSTASIKDGTTEIQDCLANVNSATCYQDYLNDINHARQVLEPGVPAMNINIGVLRSLSPAQQLFVLANADRVDRGEKPFAALTSQLNNVALIGAQGSIDPKLSTVSALTGNVPVDHGKDSNWAGGNYENPIVAEYIWMYDDGPTPGSLECSSPGQALCWGHRFNILDNGFNTCDTYMGTAYSPVSTPLQRSYAEIMAGTCASNAPTDITYTWQQALNSGVYSPPSGSGGGGGGGSPLCPRSALAVGQRLNSDQCLVSANGQYEFRFSPMSDTGSYLQVYNVAAKKQIWTTHCGGTGEYLAFGSDGNLVEYIPNPTLACWSAGTHGLGAALVTMQNDGNVVMTTASGEVVWSSQTGIIIDPPATLNANEKLLPAEQLFSATDQYRLVLQKDGNLVIYNHSNQATWATHTSGNSPSDLTMQGDGNLVLRDTTNKAIWSSNTQKLGGTHVTIQDDGNLVIRNDAGTPIWNSNTGLLPLPPPPPVSIGPTLNAGQSLQLNQYLLSAQGKYQLLLQSGTLVEYATATHQAIWNQGTTGDHLAMQSDGNLVLYNKAGGAIWSTNTKGLGGTYVTIQDDANLVIKNSGGTPVWSISTGIIVPPLPPPPTGTVGPTLTAGQAIYVNQYMLSPGGKYQLILQPDGNLVDYMTATHTPFWNAGTFGKASYRLVMQSDGNLVLYNDAGSALWSSNSRTLGGTHVTIQDDGNFVIFNAAGTAVWSMETGIITPPPPPPPPPPSTLNAGQSLYVNQYMLSPGGKYQLILQPDGNVVVYVTATHQATWYTNTFGKDSNHLAMQSDGNLVLYGMNSEVLWYTNTRTLGGTHVNLQDDGNFVMQNAAGTPVWSILTGIITPPPPPPPPAPATLYANQCLSPMQTLLSATGNYQFIMQPDGNAVVYVTANHQATWYTNTYGRGGTYFCLGGDGNVVLYNGSWGPIWYTNTQGRGGTSLTMQPDGNLVLRNGAGTPIWSIVTGVL